MFNKNFKSPKTVIIIPARLKSQRLKKKLLRKIEKIPIIARVAKKAESLNIGKVIVGTDSKQIINICERYDVECLMTKKSHKSGTDRVQEVLSLMNINFDLIINLQGDLPIFSKELLIKTVQLFTDDRVDIGSAICDLTFDEFEDRNIVKAIVNLGKDNTGFALDFKRSLKTKKNSYHHIGIYIYKPDVLNKLVKLPQSLREKNRNLEQMRALDNNLKIKLVKVDSNPPSIDTIDDLKKIRLHFKKNNL